MQNIKPLLQKGGKVGHVFVYVDLGGAGFRTVGHRLVEGVKGHGLAQIVAVGLAVQHIVEADIMNIAFAEMLFAQVGGGAAAQDVVCHGRVTHFLYLRLMPEMHFQHHGED